MKQIPKKLRAPFKPLYTYRRTITVLCVCAVVSAVTTYILYNYTKQIFTERLQERLVAIVATTATQIDANDILEVRGQNDMGKPAYERLVTTLGEVRDANSDIMYAYIMRRTDDIDTLEFVADAEGLIPPEEWDFDGDGIVGEEDEVVPLPGDPFDITEYQALRDEAFFYPVADRELEEDQWSVQLSAYAPIKTEDGETVAIMGIDVEVTNFRAKTQAMLLPFMLFILALLLLLTLLTLLLGRFHSERMAMLRELDHQKDELLSMVSHQLATPVSSIRWSLEMLRDGDYGKLSKKQSDEINLLQKSAVNLSDLVNMILDVSRIQLGRIKVDRTEVNLNEFFDEVISEIEPTAQENKIKLEVIRPKRLPKSMLDPRLLRMTLENLLSNAIKFTPKGFGTCRVTLKVEKQGDNLFYEVKDTGCGIPDSEQHKVFDKLYRASNAAQCKGTGFGLYIAKGAVEALGGHIALQSIVGSGSSFTVKIPLKSVSKKKKKK